MYLIKKIAKQVILRKDLNQQCHLIPNQCVWAKPVCQNNSPLQHSSKYMNKHLETGQLISWGTEGVTKSSVFSNILTEFNVSLRETQHHASSQTCAGCISFLSCGEKKVRSYCAQSSYPNYFFLFFHYSSSSSLWIPYW